MTVAATAPDAVAQFARHAARRPDTVALDFAGEALTYRETDRWSSALGAELLAAGVRPGDGVALLSPRSVAMTVGALAALRVNAWYVVIDPAQSAARRSLLLRRSGCRVVLLGDQVDTVDLPSGVCALELARRDAEPLPVEPDPALPAYVSFTSGTTAEPKAVQVGRGALAAFVDAFINQLGVTEGSLLAGFCAPDWDCFAIDVWVPLAAGASACSCAAADRTNPTVVARYIANRGVDVAFLPTAVGHLVMEAPDLRDAHQLRHLCLGGDRLLRRAGRDAGYTLWNVYGPTETTVADIVSPVDPEGPDDVPLGRPLPGVTMEIVDDALRPVPVGAVGEIIIGGPKVAIGYLGQPRATAAAFVPGPDGRRYRTGDLARMMPDGTYAFLGRRDRQVSVYGRRIELDGIRDALSKVDGVHKAAVAFVDTNGRPTITALVVRRPDDRSTVAEVRLGLRSWLSAQQMPDRILFVPDIPPGTHGRPDAAHLAALLAVAELPDATSALLSDVAQDDAPEAAADEPGDEVDECVVEAWAALLGGPRPVMRADFFAAGGDSLLAVQLVQHLQVAFDVELPLLEFFDAPTPRTLADLLRDALERQFEAMSEDERERLLAEPA